MLQAIKVYHQIVTVIRRGIATYFSLYLYRRGLIEIDLWMDFCKFLYCTTNFAETFDALGAINC